MFDLFGKLQALKNQVQETRDALADMQVEAATEHISVAVSGLREVKELKLDESWLRTASSEEVEDLLIATLNKALRQAREREEEAMKEAAGGLLPPGFGI